MVVFIQTSEKDELFSTKTPKSEKFVTQILSLNWDQTYVKASVFTEVIRK